MSKARQFGKLYWDEPGSLAARVLAAYVRYRCHSGPQVIRRAEFQDVLGVGLSATKKAIKEALDLGLIHRRPSHRPGDHNLQMYSDKPLADGSPLQPAQNPAGCNVTRLDGRLVAEMGRETTEVGRQATEVGREMTLGGSQIDPAHEASTEQVEQLKSNQEQEEERTCDLSARSFVTQVHIQAIRSAGDAWEYYRTTGSPRWTEALGECIASLGLSPEQVADALRRWDEGFHGDSPSEARPSRESIWFWQSRGWLMAALGIDQPSRKPRHGGFSPALSTAEAHHQRAVEAGEARRAAAAKRDPDEVAREAARYAAIFEGAEDMLL